MAERDGQLQLRLKQWAQRAAKLDRPCPGRFLSAAERADARHEAKIAGVCVSFDGGWEACERAQVCFHPEMDEAAYTAVWLEITWREKFAHIEHSDLLGSLMALGIDRAYFGDLIVQPGGCAYLYALPEAAMQLVDGWQQAGNATITVRMLDAPPQLIPPQGQMLRDTVASMRLDSVLAAGMRISRARAAEIIRQGLVQVDHLPEERVDRLLGEGQVLSVRHFGRIWVRKIDPPTRKDRLPVTLEVFSK